MVEDSLGMGTRHLTRWVPSRRAVHRAARGQWLVGVMEEGSVYSVGQSGEGRSLETTQWTSQPHPCSSRGPALAAGCPPNQVPSYLQRK